MSGRARTCPGGGCGPTKTLSSPPNYPYGQPSQDAKPAPGSSRPGFRTKAGSAYLTVAAVIYGAVTAITLYLAGRLETRISLQGTLLADRLAGILLTAIAVILLANGFTDLVTSALRR